METKEELAASELILDRGVSIPVRPLRFLQSRRKRRNIVIRQPYLGSLIRIANLSLKTGVSHEEMKDYTIEQSMAFVAKHGKTVSKIVASAILRGYWSHAFFHRIVERWLRWRVHPVFLSEAVFQLVANINISPFRNIINLTQAISPTKPRLSH